MLLPMSGTKEAPKVAKKNELKGKYRLVLTQNLAEMEGCYVKWCTHRCACAYYIQASIGPTEDFCCISIPDHEGYKPPAQSHLPSVERESKSCLLFRV
jgi:hypothetical protein